jgi:single-stranded-DNA-specific exonuclease
MTAIPSRRKTEFGLLTALELLSTDMRWKHKEIDDELVLEQSRALKIPYLHSRILLNRGLVSDEDIKTFFNCQLTENADPFILKDMEEAVNRMEVAIRRREKVLIYGDYDVDGITAASTLYLFFRPYLPEIDYYIPDRESEGYGLSNNGIDYAKENGISLIITCDCGISAIREVEYAKSLNIDVIVTDHHKPAESLPEAIAVINPKREDDQYPYKELCGAGVAFKLLQAFCLKMNLPVQEADQFLDLVAIGTAADIVPVVGENRWIMKKGLDIINSNPRLGLRELIKVSRLSQKELTVTEIVFIIAPRMNAVGRLGEASRAVKLLTTEDLSLAQEYATILDEENLRRRDIEKLVMDEALIHIQHKYGDTIPPILVLADDEWHTGVIGIVSSKLKERFHRPVILIAVTDSIGKGSGRSITGFDLYQALLSTKEHLDTFGGHTMAAGLTIHEDNILDFEQHIIEYAKELITEDMLEPRLYLEADVHIAEINRSLLDLLDKLRPFGPGNMRPKFSISNVQPLAARILSGGHLKFKIKQDHQVLDCIAWSQSDCFEMVMSDTQRIDLAFVPQINRWNGQESIQLVVKDIRVHRTGANYGN